MPHKRMPRGRMLRENVCESRKLAAVSHAANNLWFRLLTRVDDCGNFRDNAEAIKTACFLFTPMKRNTIGKLIDELVEVGLLTRYEVEDEKFLHFERFEDFQEFRYERQPKFPSNPVSQVQSAEVSGSENDRNSRCATGSPNGFNKTGDEVKDKRSKVKENKQKAPPAFLPAETTSGGDPANPFLWSDWLENPRPVGCFGWPDVQRIIYFHWCLNDRKFFRERVKTEGDLSHYIEKMNEECTLPTLDKVYHVLPGKTYPDDQGIERLQPYGMIIIAGMERKLANGEL